MNYLNRTFFLPLILTNSVIFSSIALYQHWSLKYSGGVARGFCDSKGVVGCDSVSVSPWAEPFFGLPIGALVMGLLILILILDFIPRFQSRTFPLYAWLGTGSIFYLLVMALQIRQYCSICLITHGSIWAAIILKFKQQPKIWNDEWVWRFGAIFPLLFALLLQNYALSILREKKGWERMQISDYDFKLVSPPTLPQNAPTILLGNSSGKKVDMIVAVDFMCLHCRDHFFELSRALKAHNLQANLHLLLNPLDIECNPMGGDLHPGACQASRVGICQFARGKFESFFDHIYRTPASAMGGPDTLLTVTTSSEAEKKELETCAQSPETEQTLRSHLEIGLNNNVSGTPITWVGGYKFDGQLGWKDWDKIFRRLNY
jgi:uncharacterized membrane protein